MRSPDSQNPDQPDEPSQDPVEPDSPLESAESASAADGTDDHNANRADSGQPDSPTGDNPNSAEAGDTARAKDSSNEQSGQNTAANDRLIERARFLFDANSNVTDYRSTDNGSSFGSKEIPSGYMPQPVNIPMPVTMLTIAKALALKSIEYYPLFSSAGDQELTMLTHHDSETLISSYIALRIHQPKLDITLRIKKDSARYLEIEASMAGRVTMQHIPSLARAVTGWNGERISPTARMLVHPDGQASIMLSSIFLVDKPASIEQLMEFIDLTIGAMGLAMDYFYRNVPNLSDFDIPPIDATEMGMDQDRALEGAAPKPLAYSTVQEGLRSIGISRMQNLEDGVLCIINGITFGFFLEHGPSLLIKGYWSPSLDPDKDFMRVFLACDDLNATTRTIKAFLETDEDHLQVRVEFICPAGGGLNQEQLERNLSIALRDILQAIHTISTQVSGTSAVQWPEQ